MKKNITSVRKVACGICGTEVLYAWRSYDEDTLICEASSKKECIDMTREKGYAVSKKSICEDVRKEI